MFFVDISLFFPVAKSNPAQSPGWTHLVNSKRKKILKVSWDSGRSFREQGGKDNCGWAEVIVASWGTSSSPRTMQFLGCMAGRPKGRDGEEIDQ